MALERRPPLTPFIRWNAIDPDGAYIRQINRIIMMKRPTHQAYSIYSSHHSDSPEVEEIMKKTFAGFDRIKIRRPYENR
jgi:hypothetical protein